MELLSVLNRPVGGTTAKRTGKPQVLTNWHVDDALGGGGKGGKHENFDESHGIFLVPRDGLYSIVVEVIPTDGGANVSDALSRRKEVSYAVRIEEPPNEEDEDDNDLTTEFRDVGPVSFGELIHLKSGARLSIQGLAPRRESIRLKIELIQRKRKRAREPELSKKELKKLKKKQKKRKRESSSTAASESDTTADSSEWSFSSDESGRDENDVPPSGKQLASKLKIIH